MWASETHRVYLENLVTEYGYPAQILHAPTTISQHVCMDIYMKQINQFELVQFIFLSYLSDKKLTQNLFSLIFYTQG